MAGTNLQIVAGARSEGSLGKADVESALLVSVIFNQVQILIPIYNSWGPCAQLMKLTREPNDCLLDALTSQFNASPFI